MEREYIVFDLFATLDWIGPELEGREWINSVASLQQINDAPDKSPGEMMLTSNDMKMAQICCRTW